MWKPPPPALSVLQRAVLCAAGGLVHYTAAGSLPALGWLAAPLEIAGLCGASARAAVPLGLLIGALEAWHGFGIASYGLIPVLLFVGSGSLVRGAMALPVAWVTRRLATPLWVAAVAGIYPLFDAGAEALLGAFYVPVALVDTQAESPVTLQLLALGGGWLLTAVMALWGALWVAGLQAALRARWRSAGGAAGIALALLILATGYGYGRLATATTPTQRLRVMAVQGGVPNWAYQTSMFVPAVEDAIQARYLEPTLAAAPGRYDLIIWPETAVRASAEALPQLEQLLQQQTIRSGALLLAGLPRATSDDRLRNAVVAVDRGEVVGVVTKQHLVPLLEKEFTASDGPALLDTRLGRIGVLNCVESLYHEPARTLSRRGASLLVVVANDAGVGRAPLGMIHARRASLRAVETGLAVLHVAQFGATRFYDGYGRLLAAAPGFGAAVIEAEVPVGTGRVDERSSIQGRRLR